MDIRISSKAGCEITLLNALPEPLQKFKMPHSQVHSAVCDFGTICFQEVKGDAWSIWRSRYIISEDAELYVRGDSPILVLHTAMKNHFRCDWDGIIAPPEKALQFNLSFTPDFYATGWLKKDQVYDRMDFLLTARMLTDYASAYPQLYHFLKMVELQKPANLARACTLSRRMQALLLEMEEFNCKPGLYIKLLRSRVEIFLFEALEILCTQKPEKETVLTEELKEKAMQARKILESRISDPPSIAKLAQLCLSNSYSIQLAFKKLYSKTIDDYSKELRMDFAKKLLLDTDKDLDWIADEIGYYDAASFSRFFKRAMKTTPGEYRKYARRLH